MVISWGGAEQPERGGCGGGCLPCVTVRNGPGFHLKGELEEGCAEGCGVSLMIKG